MNSATFHKCTLSLVLVALLACPGCLYAADEAPTRSDLAVAYLDLEEALAAKPPAANEIRDLNQDFDQATLQFFTGRYAPAIRTIRGLAQRIRFGGRADEAERTLHGLRVRITPATYVLSSAAPVRIEFAAAEFFPTDTANTVRTSIRIRPRSGAGPRFDQTVDLQPGPIGAFRRELTLKDLPADLAAGVYVVELAVAGRTTYFPVALWRIVPRALADVRTELSAAADALEIAPALAPAKALVHAQTETLLQDAPSDENQAAQLADPLAIERDLRTALPTLRTGTNPYANAPGESWRRLGDSTTGLPYRLFAPAVAREERSLPLIIALHGAGGDENMFFYGYGAGRIRTVAEQLGVIVVTPRTEPLLANPSWLPSLIDAVAADYRIDRQRIYLLGHSLGSVTALELAKRSPQTYAAIACFAGGGSLLGFVDFPPLLLIGGAVDPISPPAQLERLAREARDEGLTIEARIIPDYGHTLTVGAQLEAAMKWLLEHTRGES